MDEIHRLLQRQIKKTYGSLEKIPAEMMSLIESVSNSYKHYESERALLSRIMALSHEELTESNNKLYEESQRHNILFASLKESIKDVSIDGKEIEENDLLRVADILKTEIAKRKNAEQEVALREDKYRNIIENMELGLVEIDLEGNIISAYNKFCEMLGYTPNEINGIKIDSLLYDRLNNDLTQSQNGKRKLGYFGLDEIQLKHKKGHKVWMMVSVAPIINANGDVTGSVEVHFDITHRKKIEADLVETREFAENSLKSKELFLANMSHEIRTPMNAIIGMSRLMEGTNLTAEQEEYQSAIQTSAEGLLVIINEILDMSRISAGKFSFEEIDFALDPILQNLIKSLSIRAEEKGIYLRMIKDPELKTYYKSAPNRLNQILVNLIGNAIKFTQKGGVDVFVELVKSHKNSDVIKFSVKDTGIGIDANRVGKIFDSFTQEDVSTSRKYGGSGLGLTISKELVKLFGGELLVESKKEEGSIFSFSLELSHGDVILKNEEAQVIEKNLKGINVLLVEDNRINRLLASKLMNKWNVNVYEAINGYDALDKITQRNYHLVLMDMQMPEMDGLEATRKIRKDLNLDTPIIALTANAIKGEREKCIKAGMNDYISKPFLPDDLYQKISELNNL
ncbi:MAG: response regulator [Salibacteraceae bacterium]